MGVSETLRISRNLSSEGRQDNSKGQQLQSPRGERALWGLQTWFYGKYDIHKEKGRKRSLCAELGRLASFQSAVRTIDGHKARSHRMLSVLFKRSLRLQWRREGTMPHARNIKAETE